MKCNYCGADNKADAKFCASCGAELKEKKKETKKEEPKVEKVEVKEVKSEPVKDGKATASLVLGICSLVIWCLTWILSLIGLILGIASKERSGKRTAGIVINAIALGISTIFAILCFMSWAIVGAAFEEVSRSGDFEKFFEIIEEEYEKQENNNIIKPSEPVITDSSKIVGNDHYGYVKVPTTWVEFTDVDNPSVYQYTDIGEAGYIITLQTYEDDVTPYQAAINLKNKIESEGNEVVLKTAIIGSKYVAYKLDAKYSDNSYIDIYLFKADDKLRFISIEGPDDTNESFEIPKTYSLSK